MQLLSPSDNNWQTGMCTRICGAFSGVKVAFSKTHLCFFGAVEPAVEQPNDSFHYALCAVLVEQCSTIYQVNSRQRAPLSPLCPFDVIHSFPTGRRSTWLNVNNRQVNWAIAHQLVSSCVLRDIICILSTQLYMPCMCCWVVFPSILNIEKSVILIMTRHVVACQSCQIF